MKKTHFMKKTILILIVFAMFGAITNTNAQPTCNGGQEIEYLGLYSYRADSGKIVFKMATEDWTSIQEFKKSKEKQGFRLEDSSKSTIVLANNLKKQRQRNIDMKRFLEKVLGGDLIEIANLNY